jgi:hypothetical protein
MKIVLPEIFDTICPKQFYKNGEIEAVCVPKNYKHIYSSAFWGSYVKHLYLESADVKIYNASLLSKLTYFFSASKIRIIGFLILAIINVYSLICVAERMAWEVAAFALAIYIIIVLISSYVKHRRGEIFLSIFYRKMFILVPFSLVFCCVAIPYLIMNNGKSTTVPSRYITIYIPKYSIYSFYDRNKWITDYDCKFIVKEYGEDRYSPESYEEIKNADEYQYIFNRKQKYI